MPYYYLEGSQKFQWARPAPPQAPSVTAAIQGYRVAAVGLSNATGRPETASHNLVGVGDALSIHDLAKEKLAEVERALTTWLEADLAEVSRRSGMSQ